MGTSASRAIAARTRTFAVAIAAFILGLCLMPATSFGVDAESVGAGLAPAHEEGSGDAERSGASSVRGEGATPNSSIPAGNEGSVLASALAGSTSSILCADIPLDASDPLVGSFTIDGLTYSVNADGVTLVAVDASAVAEDGSLAVPAAVAYNDTTYDVTAIGPYAFYLSGAADAVLPASVASVDSRAFRTSAVGSVSAEDGNPSYASFDGALYSADLSSLLLIPEGRAGSVSIPSETEVAEPSVFSHCSLVEAISVDGDGAAFASWDGLLYDAFGETLLRVPAGATEITIRDGCTTIAAGALEGCAKLERINAPATVASISSDIFTSVPTVSLPATAVVGSAGSSEVETQMASQDEANPGVASSLLGQSNDFANFIPQITAVVALATVDNGLLEIDSAVIEVALPEGADRHPWQDAGFAVVAARLDAASDVMSLQQASSFRAIQPFFSANGGTYYQYADRNNSFQGDYSTATVFVQQFRERQATGSDAWSDSWQVQGRYMLGDQPSIKTYHYGYAIHDDGRPNIGWANTPDGPLLPTGTYVRDLSPMAVYAIYENEYGLTFSKGEGSGGTDTVVAPYGEVVPSVEPPTRSGYVFAGYFTEAGGKGDRYYDGAGQGVKALQKRSAMTLHAYWVRDSYTLSFNANGEGAEAPEAVTATYGEDFLLPGLKEAVRPGYALMGWDTQADGKGTRYVPGEAVPVSQLLDVSGNLATAVLYAQWCMAYDLTLPVASLANARFDVDADTMEVRAVGESADADSKRHSGTITSSMAVPVALSKVECEALAADDGRLGLEHVFNASSADDAKSKLSFTLEAATGGAAEVAPGGSTTAVADFVIPAVRDGGSLGVSYGMKLAEGVGPADFVADTSGVAVPVASITYTADVVGGIAANEDLFILDAGASGRVVGLAEIKEDANILATGASHPRYQETYEQYRTYLDNPDAYPGYVKVHDKPDGGYTVHQVQILGIAQDTLTTPVDGRTKAGLTFGWRDAYAVNGTTKDGVAVDNRMVATNTNLGGYEKTIMVQSLGTLYNQFGDNLRSHTVVTWKTHQVYENGGYVTTYPYAIFIPSAYEVFGTSNQEWNRDENASNSFQYQWFAKGGQGQTNYGGYARRNYIHEGWPVEVYLRSAVVYGGHAFCHTTYHNSANYDEVSLLCNFSSERFRGMMPCFCL